MSCIWSCIRATHKFFSQRYLENYAKRNDLSEPLYEYLKPRVIDAFHAAAHTLKCRQRNAQFRVRGTGHSNGSVPEITNRVLNQYRRITADLRPHLQHMQFYLVAKGLNDKAVDKCVRSLRATARRIVRLLFHRSQELAALMSQYHMDEADVTRWSEEMSADAAGQATRDAGAHKREGFSLLAELQSRAHGLDAHATQNPVEAMQPKPDMQRFKKILMAQRLDKLDDFAKMTGAAMTKMRADLQLDATSLESKLRAEHNGTYEKQLQQAEEALPASKLGELGPLLQNAYMQWRTVQVLLGERSSASKTEATRLRNSMRHLKEVYELLINIHNAWLWHANDMANRPPRTQLGDFQWLDRYTQFRR